MKIILVEGKKIIAISKKYFRPQDVNNLLGNSKKAKKFFELETKNQARRSHFRND